MTNFSYDGHELLLRWQPSVPLTLVYKRAKLMPTARSPDNEADMAKRHNSGAFRLKQRRGSLQRPQITRETTVFYVFHAQDMLLHVHGGLHHAEEPLVHRCEGEPGVVPSGELRGPARVQLLRPSLQRTWGGFRASGAAEAQRTT